MEIKLSNGKIEATVSARGAELIDLKKEGRAILWCGDPAVWGFHAPILFPICGGLRDDKYLYRGKEYELKKHGFARTAEFAIEEQDATVASAVAPQPTKCLPASGSWSAGLMSF